jgi:hypothetical protein
MLRFRESNGAVAAQRGFPTAFGKEAPTKCGHTTGTSCLTVLATSVKTRAPEGDQSMKLRWIQILWLSFALHANQTGILPDRYSAHNSAKHSAEMFEIWKMYVPNIVPRNSSRKKFVKHFSVTSTEAFKNTKFYSQCCLN